MARGPAPGGNRRADRAARPFTPVFTHCLTCHAPFPAAPSTRAGGLADHLPVPAGSRFAYDPERGRLWTVCQACGGWTLAPFDERWEAVEALERLVTDTGPGRRALPVARTDHVTLFQAGGSGIIRVGESTLTEEAAWRYGRSPGGTFRRSGGGPSPFRPRPLSVGESLLGAAAVLRTALTGTEGPAHVGELRRWVRYGTLAWRGKRRCAACGHVFRELTFFDAGRLILREGGGDALTPSLLLACSACRGEREGGLHLEGVDAVFALRRVMAYRQDGGVGLPRIRAAMNLIEGGGGAAGLSSILARYERYLGNLPETAAVALRVLADDARERRLLAMEARALEERWRAEEELAAIVDSELTEVPALERMRLKLREE